jgi:acetoin utilization deacetylase AcuC-like enzyme
MSITAMAPSRLYQRGDVLYVSTHQFPLYPGTGDFPEIGIGRAGFTINFPLPPGLETLLTI